MAQISFTNKQGGQALPPGEYEIVLTDYAWGTSNGQKTSGSETLNCKFETRAGATLWDTLIFAPATEWKVSAFLRCFGVFADEGAPIEVDDRLLSAFLGRVFGTVSVRNEEYNGRTRSRIEAYRAADKTTPSRSPMQGVPPQAKTDEPATENLLYSRNTHAGSVIESENLPF